MYLESHCIEKNIFPDVINVLQTEQIFFHSLSTYNIKSIKEKNRFRQDKNVNRGIPMHEICIKVLPL